VNDGFKAVRVTDNVWWVGAVDWGVRDFHGYKTSRGTTYNAYLVTAETPVLVDTVKKPFFGEMMSRVASVIEPGKIRCIVSNHSEMDHSGALPEAIAAIRPEKVFASEMGRKALGEHFHGLGDVTAVREGEKVSLGNMSLAFLETKMVHWPDSMVSYLDADKLLFSQDGFGMHLASGERFADELPGHVLDYEAAKYYANILLPLSGLVVKVIEKIKASGLEIGVIAPDHGPIWRKEPLAIVEKYAAWATQKPLNKTVIAYDTMWGSTELMAMALGDGAAAGGSRVRLFPLKSSHRSDVAAELLDAGALVVGSPTINNGLFPTVADMMAYLKGLKRQGLAGAAFGSYGWSGEAVKHLEETLAAMNVEKAAESVRSKYVPDADTLARCRALGETVAAKLKGLPEAVR